MGTNTPAADRDDEIEWAKADAYSDGFDEGHEVGYQAAIDECRLDIPEPADLLNRMEPWQWQDYYDRLKAEAARLGVRV